MPISITMVALMLISSLLFSPILALISLEIDEELTSGTVIANMINLSRINLTTPSSSNLRFSFLTRTYMEYFVIDPMSSDIKSSRPFDRDTLCAAVSTCVLDTEVALIEPVDLFQVFPVQFIIKDINDNSPSFATEFFQTNIFENAAPGSSYALPIARDSDIGMYTVVRYELLPNLDYFQLAVNADDNGRLTPYLKVMKALDRESTAKVRCTLMAFDGGRPSRSAALPLDIIISDINDNSPVFGQNEYNVTIPEDQPMRVTFLQVSASDIDDGVNANIRFMMTPESSDTLNNLFNIGSVTGELSLTRQLMSDYKEIYIITIMAIDGGVEPRSSTVKVSIYIDDVNNFSPVITLMKLTNQSYLSVSENLDPGVFVGYIGVEDLDRGVNGLVSCIVNTDLFRLEKIYYKTYKLMSAVRFDREQLDSYSLLVTCFDLSVNPRTSSLSLDVIINDANDNPPIFTNNQYCFSIDENYPINKVFASVTANDADDDVNAVIKYSLGTDAQQLFDIDPDTGQISPIAVLDYEQLQQVVVTVIAQDKGVNPLSGTALVEVSIINENDCRPLFLRSSYTFGIFENERPYTEVGQVHALDNDLDPYNGFYYVLDDIKGSQGQFTVDRFSGKILSLQTFDREVKATYELTVLAVDNLDSTLSSTASVTVFIADRNDNTPLIGYPSDNDTIEVSSYAPVGHIFDRVKATDKDIAANSILLYTMSYSGERVFDIDVRNGAIVLSKEPTDIDSPLLVTVMVADSGTPSLNGTVTFYIIFNTSLEFAELLSIPVTRRTIDPDLGYHHKVVILLSSVTAVLIVIIVAAIIFIRQKQFVPKTSSQGYLCQGRSLSSRDYYSTCSTMPAERSFDVTSSVDSRHADMNSPWHKCTLTSTQEQRSGSAMADCNRSSSTVKAPMDPLTFIENDLKQCDQLKRASIRLRCDEDSCTTDCSNTDSGRGTSDDGDPQHHSGPPDTRLHHLHPLSAFQPSRLPVVTTKPWTQTPPVDLKEPHRIQPSLSYRPLPKASSPIRNSSSSSNSTRQNQSASNKPVGSPANLRGPRGSQSFSRNPYGLAASAGVQRLADGNPVVESFVPEFSTVEQRSDDACSSLSGSFILDTTERLSAVNV